MTTSMRELPRSAAPRLAYTADGQLDLGDLDWRQYASCRGVPSDVLFPTDANGDEPPHAPPDVRRLCDACPVRVECLQDGQYERFGVRGGLTGNERGLTHRPRSRARCPSCDSNFISSDDGGQTQCCLACSFSWLSM